MKKLFTRSVIFLILCCIGCQKKFIQQSDNYTFVGEWSLAAKPSYDRATPEIPSVIAITITSSELAGEIDVVAENLSGFGTRTTTYSEKGFECDGIYHRLIFSNVDGEKMRLYMRNFDSDQLLADKWYLMGTYRRGSSNTQP